MNARRALSITVASFSMACGAPQSGRSTETNGAVSSGTDERSARLVAHTAAESCELTLCIAGAITRSTGSNPLLTQLCGEVKQTVEDCSWLGGCDNTFTFWETSSATKALFNALDTNQDGVVDDNDTPCSIGLVGYSWGGADIFSVASSFLSNGSVSPSRAHVDRMVAIDPYSPLVSSPLDVADGVIQFWEYRHSISPASDCSRGSPLGPYQGIRPRCGSGSRCTDYDYSLNPNDTFDGGIVGSEVGHCSIVQAAYSEVLMNLTQGGDGPNVPATVQPELR